MSEGKILTWFFADEKPKTARRLDMATSASGEFAHTYNEGHKTTSKVSIRGT